MFDGTMHYVLSEAIWKFFADRRWSLLRSSTAGIPRAMMLYPQEVQNSAWNFLSSHDTARMLTRCGAGLCARRRFPDDASRRARDLSATSWVCTRRPPIRTADGA